VAAHSVRGFSNGWFRGNFSSHLLEALQCTPAKELLKGRYGCLLQRFPGLRRAGLWAAKIEPSIPASPVHFLGDKVSDNAPTIASIPASAVRSVPAGARSPSRAARPASISRSGRRSSDRARCAAAWSSSTTRPRPALPKSSSGNRATANRNAPPRTTAAGLLFESCSGALAGMKFNPDRFTAGDSDAGLPPATCDSGRGGEPDVDAMLILSCTSPRAGCGLCRYIHLRRSEWTKRLT
jgi:hypothetical protein